MSYKTTQKAQTTSQTPSLWWWSWLPLQWPRFDESKLLEGGQPCAHFSEATIERFKYIHKINVENNILMSTSLFY
jgi:hypothetical protein